LKATLGGGKDIITRRAEPYTSVRKGKERRFPSKYQVFINYRAKIQIGT